MSSSTKNPNRKATETAATARSPRDAAWLRRFRELAGKAMPAHPVAYAEGYAIAYDGGRERAAEGGAPEVGTRASSLDPSRAEFWVGFRDGFNAGHAAYRAERKATAWQRTPEGIARELAWFDERDANEPAAAE